MMRFWVGVSAAFGAGTLIGIGLGAILTEDKFRKEYKESTASFQRAMELVHKAPQSEPPAESEEELVRSDDKKLDVTITVDTEKFAEGVEKAKEEVHNITGLPASEFKPQAENPYHVALEKPAASWTYLEAEDYEEEDGRYKGQITILPDDETQQPIFIENGIQISNWEEKIGGSILRDFYTMVKPGQAPVLYVRNNVTDEDYEVIREMP